MQPPLAAPGQAAGRLSWFDLVAGLAAVGLVAGTAVWVLTSPFPRLQDLPEWMYQGHLLALLLQGDAEAAGIVRIAPYLPPNALTQLLIAALNLVVPPIAAGQFFLLAYLAAFLAVAMLLARAAPAGSRGPLLLVLIGTFALNLSFWKGLSNFQLGLLLFAWFVWLWTIKGWHRPWLLLVASVLIFAAHAAIFAVFVAYVLLGEVLRDPDRRLSLPRAFVAAALAPSLALLVWYMLANATQFDPAPTGDEQVVGDTLGQFIAYKIYTVMKLGPTRTFQPEKDLSFLSGHPALYWYGVVLNGAYAGALGLAIFVGLRDQGRRCRWRGPGMLPLALLLCITPALLLLPQIVFHINNLGERLMIPAVLTVVATVALPPPALRVLAVLILGALPLTASYLIAPYGLAEKTDAPDGQYYFTVRSNQFVRHYPWLASPGDRPLRPIVFDTSILLSLRPKAEPTARQ